MFAKGMFKVVFAIVLLLTLAFSGPTLGSAAPGPTSPAAVITWNGIAQRAAITVGKQYQTQSMIYISFVQAAVYDAVVAIEGGYEPYKLSLRRRPNASIDAAVATAAHHVLVHYFPAQQAALDDDYGTFLAAIPADRAKEAGIAVGAEAAAGIIALRQGDGLEANIGLTMPDPAPGVWELPSGQSPQTPWVSKLAPFMLERPDQFRSGPPPVLSSATWATEYNEVKTYGGSDSTMRTAEQTAIARFWSTNSVVQYNIAFKDIALSRGLDAVQAARLFAMGNLVGSDALIGCFDAKYHYLFWRPVFAVHEAAADRNPATEPDLTWQPLLATPNHPEYPAAHGCLTAAEAEVFAHLFGADQIDVVLSSAVPAATTRHYTSADDLVEEIINARVWGGLHYRGSVVEGTLLGCQVAEWTLSRYFLPDD